LVDTKRIGIQAEKEEKKNIFFFFFPFFFLLRFARYLIVLAPQTAILDRERQAS
jgi:hypothetical protein